MKGKIILVGLFILFSFSCFSQQENLDFVQKKYTGDSYTVYFEVTNLVDEAQSQQILEDFLRDDKIKEARYYKSGEEKDRFQLIMDCVITASYIKKILLTHNVDYDYNTIIVDGVNPQKGNYSDNNVGSKGFHVSSLGFPSYTHTGNKEIDNENYRKAKDEWIEENPDEYESLLQEQKNNKKE